MIPTIEENCNINIILIENKMTKKIINGHNPNEVKLVNKTRENKGFFEKFFNFFN